MGRSEYGYVRLGHHLTKPSRSCPLKVKFTLRDRLGRDDMTLVVLLYGLWDKSEAIEIRARNMIYLCCTQLKVVRVESLHGVRHDC